jgi:hypothetical protein
MSVELLEAAAAEFGDLLERVVFLGGATIGLWITDPTARAPRVTYDVDVVAEVVTLGAYEAFQTDLRRQGFREDLDSGVMSRWRAGDGDLIVDVVPADPRLAGFGGVWLQRAAEAAVDRELPSGRSSEWFLRCTSSQRSSRRLRTAATVIPSRARTSKT